MDKDYTQEIREKADQVFEEMSPRTSAEDMARLRRAFEFACEAHAPQKRKTGEPYILHPIAVARIAATELQLDVNSVIAAFLHDVVEDTPHSAEEISRLFGNDVAFLVRAVTKQKKKEYVMSKQVDNFRQMLDAMRHDIRVILVKLADRLHNMRTLASMPPDKQMKIAGETDYFYAPLATRLGLYNVKTELENLSLKFRCPHEYDELTTLIERDRAFQRTRLSEFATSVEKVLADNGIAVRVHVDYRLPYSLWRKMRKTGDDFNHLKYRHFTQIVFTSDGKLSEKDMTLRIYSILTDRFKEKPGGISNYIDSPKENGYQSFHFKLMADFGRWQEVHISSERMMRESQIGCVADSSTANIRRWLDKFKGVLGDIHKSSSGSDFIDNVVATFYNDDIMVFSPKGKPVVLPQGATVIDFAYEIHTQLGQHAQYARINGQLSTVKTRLHRGDVVEIFTSADIEPRNEWLDYVVTYKARKAVRDYLSKKPRPRFHRCPVCNPIPGEEVIGFLEANDTLTVHKRDCSVAIREASQFGDRIVSVDFEADATLYPVKIYVRAVDRFHLFIDIVNCITDTLQLTMHSFNTESADGIVDCHIAFAVHSFTELQHIIAHIAAIPGVDEVKNVASVAD